MKKKEKNMKELSSSPGKRSFLDLPALLDKFYTFGLDTVQKMKRPRKLKRI